MQTCATLLSFAPVMLHPPIVYHKPGTPALANCCTSTSRMDPEQKAYMATVCRRFKHVTRRTTGCEYDDRPYTTTRWATLKEFSACMRRHNEEAVLENATLVTKPESVT